MRALDETYRSESRMSDRADFDHDVFVCCCEEVASDSLVADKLVRQVRSYRIPRSIRRRLPKFGADQSNRKSRLRVARCSLDDANAHKLTRAHIDQLLRSRHLIVVCSPDAPRSQIVAEHILAFRHFRGPENILALLIGGEPKDAFPVPLRDPEPIAADIRAANLAEVLKKLKGRGIAKEKQAKFKLLAPILGCKSPDELVRRHRVQSLRRMYTAIPLLVLLTVVAIGIKRRQEHQIQIDQQAQSLLDAIHGGEEYDLEHDLPALEAIASSDKDVRIRLLDQLLTNSFNAKRLKHRLAEITFHVVGTDPQMRDAALEMLLKRGIPTPDDPAIRVACATVGTELYVDEPNIESMIAANQLATTGEPTRDAAIKATKDASAEPFTPEHLLQELENPTRESISRLVRRLAWIDEPTTAWPTPTNRRVTSALFQKLQNHSDANIRSMLAWILGRISDNVSPENSDFVAQRILADLPTVLAANEIPDNYCVAAYEQFVNKVSPQARSKQAQQIANYSETLNGHLLLLAKMMESLGPEIPEREVRRFVSNLLNSDQFDAKLRVKRGPLEQHLSRKQITDIDKQILDKLFQVGDLRELRNFASLIERSYIKLSDESQKEFDNRSILALETSLRNDYPATVDSEALERQRKGLDIAVDLARLLAEQVPDDLKITLFNQIRNGRNRFDTDHSKHLTNIAHHSIDVFTKADQRKLVQEVLETLRTDIRQDLSEEDVVADFNSEIQDRVRDNSRFLFDHWELMSESEQQEMTQWFVNLPHVRNQAYFLESEIANRFTGEQLFQMIYAKVSSPSHWSARIGNWNRVISQEQARTILAKSMERIRESESDAQFYWHARIATSLPDHLTETEQREIVIFGLSRIQRTITPPEPLATKAVMDEHAKSYASQTDVAALLASCSLLQPEQSIAVADRLVKAGRVGTLYRMAKVLPLTAIASIVKMQPGNADWQESMKYLIEVRSGRRYRNIWCAIDWLERSGAPPESAPEWSEYQSRYSMVARVGLPEQRIE